MNRIDTRPAAPVSSAADGAQLQRRMLQELERQWLNSWGTASAAQPEAPRAAAEQETKEASFQALADNTSSGGLRSGTGPGSQSADGQAPASSSSARIQTTDASPERAAPHDQLGKRPGTDNESANTTEGFPGATASAQQDASALNVAAVRASTTTLASVVSVDTLPSVAAPPVTVAAAAPGLLTMPPHLAPLQNGTEPEVTRESSARPYAKPQAEDAELGPQKLTLRELAPDLVQAALRDTQLDLSASQLAAQGLARALMEAGYAQVRVVVNGQPSRGERADSGKATALAARSDDFTESIPETASKDRSHGN